MNNGWVKLHRQILTNDIFRHDPTAWRVFEVLLVMVDSKNGKWSGGLYQLSDFTGIKKDALYKALKRLEEAGMINRLVNARYTVYSICKWGEYQGNNDSSVNAQYTLGKQTVNAQYNSNKKENKNKKENNIKSKSDDVRPIYDFYIQSFGANDNQYKLTPARQAKIRARLKDAGAEMLTEAIKRTSESEFHRGSNDRGWRADLDFIIRSYEQTEKLAGMEVKNSEEDLFKKEQEEFIRRKNVSNQSNLR